MFYVSICSTTQCHSQLLPQAMESWIVAENCALTVIALWWLTNSLSPYFRIPSLSFVCFANIGCRPVLLYHLRIMSAVYISDFSYCPFSKTLALAKTLSTLQGYWTDMVSLSYKCWTSHPSFSDTRRPRFIPLRKLSVIKVNHLLQSWIGYRI